MPTTKKPIMAAAARIGRLYINGVTPDPDALADAQRKLAEAKIAWAIADALTNAPRLTDDQLDRLSRQLVRGGVAR